MSTFVKNLRIAFVHDWILGVAGDIRVLKEFHEIFPEAPIYVLFYDKKFTDEFLPGTDIKPSCLQKKYEILGSHKLLMPLLPTAVESLDLSDFDLVISTAPFAKGLILKPRTIHINYCSSPTRQFWDWHAEYKKESRMAPKSWLAVFQHFMRIWDRHASARVDYFIANSKNTARRIKKYYGKDSTVIYPPVDTNLAQSVLFDSFTSSMQTKQYFLIVSRLYKHKNVDLAVKAFSKLGWPLIVIGDGPELHRLKKLANGNADIIFLGFQPDNIVKKYYENCLAFIMPQEEDFGMTPIEAMSYGKPVLALKRGGALEYLKEGINGEFFEDPAEEMIADGARRLKENLSKYNPEEIKKTTEQFSIERFSNQIKIFVNHATQNRNSSIAIQQF